MVCVKWRVFFKEELILSSIVLVTLKEWLILRNKLNYTHTNFGAKVHFSSTYSFNRLSKSYIRFFKECGVCGNNMESTS